MIGNRVFRNGKIFCAAGGAGRFGEVDRFARPKDILLAFFYLFNERLQGFIVAEWHLLFKIVMTLYSIKLMLFTKLSRRAAIYNFLHPFILMQQCVCFLILNLFVDI